MATNVFSPLLKGERDWYTRVGHSATNWFSSIDRTSFGFAENSYRPSMQNVSAIGGGLTNAATNFAGTAGAAAGTVTLALSATAAGAVAGAGFLAAIAGPQIAITGGVIGLAMLVKSTYSNREAAHKALYPHVWNMVDDQAPLGWNEDNLKAAAAAAITLMDDGKNQIKLLGEKLSSAEARFNVAQAAMDKLRLEHNQIVMSLRAIRNPASPQHKAQVQRANSTLQALRAMFTKEMKERGAIFDYIRRLSHTGNYIQAPGIIALAMKQQFRHNYAIPSGGAAASLAGIGDYFADVPSVITLRTKFIDLDKLYQAALQVTPQRPL